MASLNELVGTTFQPTNTSANGFVPDTSQLATTGAVTIPADMYYLSDYDGGNPDTQTINSVDLTDATSYRLGTMVLTESTPTGAYPPVTFDIIGLNGDQLLLGAGYEGSDNWGSYLLVSNTDISETDGYTPTTMNFSNTNTYAYDPASTTMTPETGIASIVGRVFQPTNTSANGFVPDTSQLATNGTVTIPADVYYLSDYDGGNPDTQTIDSVDLSDATSYRIGTAVLTESTPTGAYPPVTFDIIAEDGDQILLGAGYEGSDNWGSYLLLSNTDISTSDGYNPPNLTLVNQDVYSGDSTSSQVPCFAAGSMVSTPAGPVAVESLKAGDLVLTVAGEARELVWVGHRRIDLSRHAAPELVRPVRIAAGAFGLAQPNADLTVSPDHNLFVNGVLIPAKCLVNGRNVVELDVAAVTYHHIELATHDVVLANNMPAETYLDTGNRANFAGQVGMVAHPDFASAPDLNYFAWVAAGFAPLVLVGPELDAVRARLAARADIPALEILAA